MPDTVQEQTIENGSASQNPPLPTPGFESFLIQTAGFFNIFTGLLLVGGILIFIGGFFSYLAHFGLPHRDEGLHKMQTGITMLFVLVIILGVIQFVRTNPSLTMTILGGLGIMLCIIIVAKVVIEANTAVPEDH